MGYGIASSLLKMRPLMVGAVFVLALLQGCAVRPDPLSLDEHQKRVQEDRQRLYAGQESLTAPLTLDMAIARALKYNYDNRLAIMEAAFHDQQLTAATYAMLPKLAANAGFSNRDNEAASSSISYKTRQETLEPSVSSERDRKTADITLSWTLLDFGLSYFQARQQGDRLLIMQERKRRVVNNMVKEVIGAYWKVLTADRLLPLVESALKESKAALASYEAVQKEGLSPPLEVLEQHRDLLTIVSQLRRIQADLTMSRIKLAALINVPLSSSFAIAPPDARLLMPPKLAASLPELEDKGLAMRPDLREESYQERIDKVEVYKEILRMVPGVSLFGGYNYDANTFLVHNTWGEVGAKATMNLFSLITGPTQIKAANTRLEVTRTRRLAQTVAALVQINLSYYQYRQALEDFEYSRQLSMLEEQIMRIAQSERAYEAQSEVVFVRRSVNAVRAQIEHDRIFSDIHQYWGNLYFSLGGDIVPPNFENDDLSTMAATIRASIDHWWGGAMPFDETPAVAPTTEPVRAKAEPPQREGTPQEAGPGAEDAKVSEKKRKKRTNKLRATVSPYTKEEAKS